MATNTHIQSGAQRRNSAFRRVVRASGLGFAVITLGCGASTAAAENAAPAASAAQTRDGCFANPMRMKTASTPARSVASRVAYDWPLKPFNRQHPIRGFFNDPRNGDHGSHSFHFGIDISGADGTPVYAVLSGTVHMTSGRAIAIVHSGGWSTAYWHIVPVVHHRQWVRKHQLIGRIEASWLHVHFAERRNGEFVNPLRPGALGPYSDETPPTIAGARFTANGQAQGSEKVRGSVNLVVDAYDTTPMRVPAPWNDLPVTPAKLQWRVVKDGRPVVRWRVGVDFRYRLVRASQFDAVYAPPTQKNYPPKIGRYCFYVARGWDTRSLANGEYRIQIEATDTRGNRTIGSARFRVANAA
jgi:hypothetical protein